MWTIAIARLARAGPELLAEDPLLAGCHGRVVEAAGVDGDLVPVVEPGERADPMPRWMSRHWVELRHGLVPRPQRVINTARESACPDRHGQAQGEQSQC